MPLIASRFLETRERTIDLATAGAVTLRRLPPCPPADERRWLDACSRLACRWHEDLPPLLDFGFVSDGRFEAYGCAPARRTSADASEAVSAFLDERPWTTDSDFKPVRIGMTLLVPDAVGTLGEVLDDSCPGQPLEIACVAEPASGGSTFLRLAASQARRQGYVPVAIEALREWPDVFDVVQGRSVLLLAEAGEPPRAARRWLFAFGISSLRSHALLRLVDGRPRGCDVTLRLDAIDPDALATRVHVYPGLPERAVKAAAEASGGLPGRFIAALRQQPLSRSFRTWRVAEAHPAYDPEDAAAAPRVEHPWRDLISDAVRLAAAGRRAAAERDLRQIAAAAERRDVALAASAATVELGWLLLARGRVADARELFAARAKRERSTDPLATAAGVGLGWAHLLNGDLEAAEGTFRVCRPDAPAEAAVGLGWTLWLQGRDVEAERAIAPARDSIESAHRIKATALGAALALAQQNLPAASRGASDALEDERCDPVTECVAAMLQAIVHGRIGDPEAVARHARRALLAAKTARVPMLALAVRAAVVEAQHACGQHPSTRVLDRVLRVAERVPPLLRARLWAVAARTAPADRSRAECAERLQSFVRATGARALSLAAAEAPGAALASDTAVLVDISESSGTPMETLQRVAEWLAERLNARGVSICDATGSPMVRAGAAPGAVAAAGRVLQTRIAQPPWATPRGLESAVVIRYANVIRGAVACRWSLSKTVGPEAVPVMTAAASIVAPAIALLAQRASLPDEALDGMVGRSRAMIRLRELIARAALAPFPVLVEGESGAGKELVARAIHRASPRRLRAFVAINCAALSDDLFEAEVFGHARGAFTGAHAERAGLFEQADGGTLFLDEVSELSARAQAKLLRALQEGEVRRIGENHARRVDVRVVAASNRRLEDEAAAGRFRRDLLFRLAVLRMSVPALRDRREDIPLLAAHCWDAAVRRAGARSVLSPAAIARLSAHEWPGNVRELQNVIAALAVQVPRGRVGGEHVAALIGPAATEQESGVNEISRLDEARQAFERRYIAAAIARCGGRHGAAARQLGITRQGLAKLLKRLEVD